MSFYNLSMIEMNETNSTSSNSSSAIGLKWNLAFRLAVLGFGLVTNIINVLAFLSPKLKDTCYKYMLATTLNNLIYLIINVMGILFYYCLNCSSSQTYFAAVYSIAASLYLSNCTSVMRILLDVTISLRTYFILINKNLEWLSYKIVLVILMCISLLYYAQIPFSYSPSTVDFVTYSVHSNTFGSSTLNRWLIIGQYIVRMGLAVVVLSIVNVLNLIQFRKRYQRRGVFTTEHIIQANQGKRVCLYRLLILLIFNLSFILFPVSR